jgi:hypothetical protein
MLGLGIKYSALVIIYEIDALPVIGSIAKA